MFRSGFAKIGFAAAAVVLTGAIAGSSQDLGSSNKLFGGSKPAAGAKKPAAGTKSAASKPKPEPKKSTAASSAPKTTKALRKPEPQPKKTTTAAKTTAKPGASKPNESTAKTKPAAPSQPKAKFTENKTAQTSKVEITVGKSANVPPASPVDEARFEDLIEDGNVARDERNYAAAEAAYKAARVAKARDYRAMYGLGNLFSDQQRWEEAENAYRSALQIDPTNAIVHIALSYVLTQPIASPNLSQRYEEAETIARKAIQFAPSNALAFDQLGVALELRGLIGQETEDAYRRAIRLNGSFAPAHAHLGRLLRRRGMNKEAAAAYETAIKKSTDVATKILVAEVLQSEQRFSESEPLLKKALDEDPKNPSALLLLARAFIAQSKYDDAESTLRRSLGVSPSGFTANNLLATLFIRQGSFPAAESALLEALKTVSPLEKRSLSQQFESVGDGFMKLGDRRAAERSYRQAINLDVENQSLVGKLSRAQKG